MFGDGYLSQLSSKTYRNFLALGIILFAMGCLWTALVPGETLAIGVRWLGLAVLAFVGIRNSSLTFWIFFSMLLGLAIGLEGPGLAAHLRVLSDIFLRLIKVIVAPLILGTLITGIAGHGDLRKLGRIGLKSLVYFEAVTTIALFIGVGAINLTKAGVGLVLPAVASETAPQPTTSLKWGDFLLHIFPENIVQSVAENQILQVAVFAVLFAVALTKVPEKTREPILNFAESLTQTMFRLTNIVMYFAPIGVGAAMAFTVGNLGINALLPLGKLVLTAYAAFLALVLFVFVPIIYFARLPLGRFLKSIAEPATIAFATSASGAALPSAMENMEAFGVPRRIVGFVIPAGYSFNMDGGTVYLAVASVFVAQAAGIHMAWSAQLLMIFTLMLTSKGIAGVPRATLVILLATAASLNLPTEPIFIIMGVDAIIDMARTAVNVIGNCLASAVIAQWEDELTDPTAPKAVQS